MTLLAKRVLLALTLLGALAGWQRAQAGEATAINVLLDAQTGDVTLEGFSGLIPGPFTVSERKSAGINIQTIFHPELANHTGAYLDATAKYIEYFSKRVGEYPYGQFTIVSSTAPVGLAFPGLTVMNRRVLALPFILKSSLPHEILHSWWGGAVDIDVEGGNWAEGLTTYMVDGDDRLPGRTRPAREQRLEWLRNYAALSPADDMALSEFRSKTHDRSQVIGYGKAAFVFHMLKNEVGEDVFDRALKRFYSSNRFKKAGWAELEQTFTEEAGFDLAPFFHQWVVRPGAPTLTARAQRTENGVKLTLRQKGLVAKGRGYFLRLPVEITTENGIEHQSVMMKGAGQTFYLKTESPPRSVHVDPGFDIFRRLSKGEAPVILRDITLAKGTTLIVVESDPAWFSVMEAVARGLLDRTPDRAPSTLPVSGGEPLIIGGSRKAVRAFLAKNGLPTEPPGDMGDEATTVRVWTNRDKGGRALLVVEIPDGGSPETLEAVARALPHYKRQSWVAFADGRAGGRGVWPHQPTAPGGLRINLGGP